ncbi:MAG: AAA family ATPase [Candidatus Methanomethylophilaceae archaeon]|nr:AAA family ATPase [Candidatus Methanomethylophilaceae archaeon]
MKIVKAKVESFGDQKDREYRFGGGFTVIYGKNETGKTTLMEFLRSTMFPDSKKNNYPKYKKTDSGQIEIVDSKGGEILLSRENRNVKALKGRTPQEATGLDPDTYRQVFAMRIDDMRDREALTSGEIRDRFLTVPGGGALPTVNSSVSNEMETLMTPLKHSDSTKIGAAMKRLKDNDAEIREYTMKEAQYAGLTADLKKLRAEREQLGKERAAAIEHEKNIRLLEAQQGGFEALERLKTRRKELEPSAVIDQAATDKLAGLEADVRLKNGIHQRAAGAVERCLSDLDGADPEAVLREENNIKHLEQSKGTYRELADRRGRLQSSVNLESRVFPDSKPVLKKRNPAILVAGTVALAACLLLGMLYSYYICIAGVAVMAVCLILYRRSGGYQVGLETVPRPESRSAAELVEVNRSIGNLENRMDSVADAVGIRRTAFEPDADALAAMLQHAKAYRAASKEATDCDTAEKNALAGMNLFLSGFGGRGRFDELVKMRREYDEVSANIAVLEQSLRGSALPSDAAPVPPLTVDGLNAMISEWDGKISNRESTLKSILGDRGADGLRDGYISAEADLYKLVRRWSVLSLAESLVDSACDAIYGGMQPGVVATADRLVRTMTGERYGLKMDLLTGNIVAVSGDSGKTSEQWSTGLGDQIHLSVKLAVAREMAAPEGLPVILDDVLQMFDSDRKRAACKALGELSKDMQILLFTCDAETFALALEEGGAEEIRLV